MRRLLQFEWDEGKNRANFKKHGVSFPTAIGVFGDPLANTTFDSDHSEYEDRWFTIGTVPSGQLLTVSHTWKDLGSNAAEVRIISAREAMNNERTKYEESL